VQTDQNAGNSESGQDKMTEILTSSQMRAVEQAAMGGGDVSGLELMERAGRGLVAAVFAHWPDLASTRHHAVVLCGPGNNGGDGFVVARLLHDWGWTVEVFFHGDAGRLPVDARANHDRWLGLGPVLPLASAQVDADRKVDLCVDALFGTGLSRPVDQGLIATLAGVRHGWLHRARRVSVDICSGLCADSGQVLGAARTNLPDILRPDLTVTFHRAKPGHFLSAGGDLTGALVVADIGISARHSGRGEAGAITLTQTCTEVIKTGGHKYQHGHAIVLSGGVGRGGAARLAARGALRIGAGVVTLACPPDALAENAARLDAVMLRPMADAGVLRRIMEDARIKALCLGPALGVGQREADLLAVALRPSSPKPDARRAVVLDADALTILSTHPDLVAQLHGTCVLTPHAGEFARLFPDLAARLSAPATGGPAFSKVDATREAARRTGAVVLFKGPDTVIADPAGRCAVNAAVRDRAAPWLATAGSGDVLAGFITGLLARGFGAFEAACHAAWLHVRLDMLQARGERAVGHLDRIELQFLVPGRRSDGIGAQDRFAVIARQPDHHEFTGPKAQRARSGDAKGKQPVGPVGDGGHRLGVGHHKRFGDGAGGGIVHLWSLPGVRGDGAEPGPCVPGPSARYEHATDGRRLDRDQPG
jgi:ADP-dependent NAD(P)H-hydrate dehydratase / NAD(P)H-hydrate epimerase